MNPTQSNTQQGNFPIPAGVDLTGKEGYLAVVTNDSGAAQAVLPTNIADLALYLVHDGAPSGKDASLDPLVDGVLRRIKLKGTCVPGDRLVLADTSTAADRGKVRKMPSANGTYRTLALAEESGADGQLVKARIRVLEPTVISG